MSRMRRLKCKVERDYYITEKQVRNLRKMYWALYSFYEHVTDCEGVMWCTTEHGRPDHAIVNYDKLVDIHDEIPDFIELVDRIENQRLKEVSVLNIATNRES